MPLVGDLADDFKLVLVVHGGLKQILDVRLFLLPLGRLLLARRRLERPIAASPPTMRPWARASRAPCKFGGGLMLLRVLLLTAALSASALAADSDYTPSPRQESMRQAAKGGPGGARQGTR